MNETEIEKLKRNDMIFYSYPVPALGVDEYMIKLKESAKGKTHMWTLQGRVLYRLKTEKGRIATVAFGSFAIISIEKTLADLDRLHKVSAAGVSSFKMKTINKIFRDNPEIKKW